MIENLFIFYANHSFREDPQNLIRFLEQVEKCNIPSLRQDDFHADFQSRIGAVLSLSGIIAHVVNTIVRFSKFDFHSAWCQKEIKKTMHGYANEDMEIAFEAVFGYHEYCSLEVEGGGMGFYTECDMKPYMNEILSFKNGSDEIYEKYFKSTNRLRCYECQQLYFCHLLDLIILDKEYGAIPGFINFLRSATDYFVQGVSFIDSVENLFAQDITVELKFKSPLNDSSQWMKGRDERFPYKSIFNDIVRSLIAYSLGEYLTSNRLNNRGKPKKEISRTKIGKCRKCGKYFIGSKANKEFCNDTCRHNYHSVKNVSSGANKEFKRMKRNEGNIKYL
jgi:hypothetical protein